jgi:hypothetical protein
MMSKSTARENVRKSANSASRSTRRGSPGSIGERKGPKPKQRCEWILAPPHHVIARRVERAKQLLHAGTDLSLAEVALHTGFEVSML